MGYVCLVIGLLAVLLAAAVACGGNDGQSSSEPVSVVRLRTGEKIDGECRFGEDISQYPVTYSTTSEDCRQAVGIGPLSLDELERMKQDVPLFWENSSPYQQALVGESVDGECRFDHPAVQAFLEFSEIVSTDKRSCLMIVEMGPATQMQLDEVQRHGNTESSTAVPARAEPVPDR